MQEPEEIIDVGHEQVLSKVASVDVAKASGMVCTRLPHPTIADRRITKVWQVPTTTHAILELADHLAGLNVERVVVESTSDYWRPFVYLLEAAGVPVWLVNAHDVKNVPGRPKTDKLDAVWLAKLAERGMLRPSFIPPPRSGCCVTTPGCGSIWSETGPGMRNDWRNCSKTHSSSYPRWRPTSWAYQGVR